MSGDAPTKDYGLAAELCSCFYTACIDGFILRNANVRRVSECESVLQRLTLFASVARSNDQ